MIKEKLITIGVVLGIGLILFGISLFFIPGWVEIPGGPLILLGVTIVSVAELGSKLKDWREFLFNKAAIEDSQKKSQYPSMNTTNQKLPPSQYTLKIASANHLHLANQTDQLLPIPPTDDKKDTNMRLEMANSETIYRTSAVRQFLLAALNEQESRELISDTFPEVQSTISNKYGLREIVFALVEYCERKGIVKELVEKAADINPYQYKAFSKDLTKNG